jgi:ABC-type nickel/cobalt efflux system permease component RcnA/Tol biopolymer transport system component
MKKITLLFIACLLFINVTAVHAHPADIYAHTFKVTITQTDLQIHWELKPGPMLVSFIWHEADSNQDEILSAQEVNAWGAPRAALLAATLDDHDFPLQLDSVSFPKDLQKFQAGDDFIVFNLSAKWTRDSTSIHTLVLKNNMETRKSINFFELSSKDNAAFLFPAQKNHVITIEFTRDRALVADQRNLLNVWDSGAMSMPVGQQKDVVTETAEQIVPELSQRTPQEILLGLVRQKDFSLSFYLFALAVSLALGALHALTPGHGKTVVAAYLVGSRGTTKHAIALGSIVTLTHTGSVFLLGMFTLAASQYILPTSIIPMLEILSGLLIVGLGLYLFWQRFLFWRKTKTPSSPTLPPSPIGRGAGVRAYSSFPKKISGPIKIQKPSENLHHHGDGKLHSHDVPEDITWRSLITLGISGGLVPCPDAIAILLVAIAINRLLLGLALIVSFSLGLAIVLIVIGLVMVHSSKLFNRMDAFTKIAPLMPVVSAAIVLVLGIGLTYGAIAKIGSSDSLLIPVSNPGVNAARVLYLTEDENDQRQLFIMEMKNHSSKKITNTVKGVVDFSLSPDQKQIVYIEQTDDLEYNLWLVNADGAQNHKIVPCKDAMCSQPVWSPDGKTIVYEYMPINEDGSGASSLWWYNVAADEAKPLFQESRLPGTNPRWSPNGAWLSYATPEGLRLVRLESGESRLIKNTLGAAAQWSPDSKSLLMRDVIVKNSQYITQLFLYDIDSQTLKNIGADENMENILAAWSPDGKSIAVVRRDLSILRGDQVWIMRADGSDARSITNVSAVLHGSLNWSPDGNYLLYDLYLLDSFPLQSRLETVNAQTGEVADLQINGYTPQWIW